MNKIESLLNSDFILSFATFFQDENLKNCLKDSKAKFVYMHPIDNKELKSSYSQFIKYEVGSEEGICALLLNSFASKCDEKTQTFLDELDVGYISAESSAGEEEFEEAFLGLEDFKVKTLIVGNDILNHERVENIIKLLALFKKYSGFNLVILDKELEQKIDNCQDFNLEEIEELKSFNGTLVYCLDSQDSDKLRVSQTFANVAKVLDGTLVYVVSKNEKTKRVLQIDEDLHGTVGILNIKNSEDIFSGYGYKQVKIEKVEA